MARAGCYEQLYGAEKQVRNRPKISNVEVEVIVPGIDSAQAVQRSGSMGGQQPICAVCITVDVAATASIVSPSVVALHSHASPARETGGLTGGSRDSILGLRFVGEEGFVWGLRRGG